MLKNDQKTQGQQNDIAEMIESIKKKKSFFFTGSGISYASQIASVGDVLSHTCDKFLPGYRDDITYVPNNRTGDGVEAVKRLFTRKDYICNIIQPELFYCLVLLFG